MKPRNSLKILILMVFSFCLLVPSKQAEQIGNASLCEFDIMNADGVKQTFEDFTKIDKVWLIFFDITLYPDTFSNKSGLDTTHMNGLTRWIWVSRKHSNLLTYPVDFDVITFQLSKNVEETISVFVNASFIFEHRNLDNYSICVESLYGTIFKTILDGNKTDWLFCNRYFKGQDFKYILYMFSGSWLGYDFACFDFDHQTVAKATYIRKGTVNVIINIFIIVLCMYLPLFVLLLPSRYNVDQSNVQFYRKGEYPNSFARLMFRLHDIPKQDLTNEIHNIKDWFDQYDITLYKPEIHMSSCLFIITLATFIFEDQYIKKVISDYTFFPDIFHFWVSNIYVNVLLLTFSYLLAIPFLIMAISYFSEISSEFYSINPLGSIKIAEVWKNVEQEEKLYFGYTKFALKFLHRMSLFFNLDLWATSLTFSCSSESCLSKMCNIIIVCGAIILNFCLYFLFLMVPGIYFVLECFLCLPVKIAGLIICSEKKIICCICFVPVMILVYGLSLLYMHYFLNVIQFVLRSIIYVIFVAGPLFANVSETVYSFWVVVLSICIYVAKYTSSFHTNYKKLLNILLQINKQHLSSNICNTESNNVNAITEGIRVQDFDAIAEKYLPLRHQLFYFFLKISLTSLFLYITFDSINQGGNDKFTTALLPNILTAAIPALAEKFCSPFNIDEALNFHAEEIKFDYLEVFQKPSDKLPTTSTICPKCLMYILPLSYSVTEFISFIYNTINRRKSPVAAQPCSTNSSTNNDESAPLLITPSS